MKQKIYLAGGFRSNWQEVVINKVNADFLDPRIKEIDNVLKPIEYGTWDFHFIKCCDIVFAYMENTNPSGIGLSVEIGYAKALGKTVILCLEVGNLHIKDSYLEFMKLASDIVFDNINDAIKYLKLF